jgi:beta-phosphoglucomutase-like phosphatase (HAD superfamily)
MAWPAPPVTLNAIAAGWRVALAAAHDALAANTKTLEPEDVRVRTSELAHERERVAALLEADAREGHVQLVRRLSLPTATRHELGLPDPVDACVCDLDGVLAPSDDLHFAAWALTFDGFLSRRLERGSEHFSHYTRFSRRTDYAENVHGKPRLDGVRAFLASRGLTLPEGTPQDPPEAETVWGLANRKNAVLQKLLAHQGVSPFAGSIRYLEAAAAAGLATVVVSASANTQTILERAGLADLVDLRVDAASMRAYDLLPQPAPDTLLLACDLIGVAPEHAAAFVTTPAGVAAARSAGLGFVVGVDRSDNGGGPAAADTVVDDLGRLLSTRLAR